MHTFWLMALCWLIAKPCAWLWLSWQCASQQFAWLHEKSVMVTEENGRLILSWSSTWKEFLIPPDHVWNRQKKISSYFLFMTGQLFSTYTNQIKSNQIKSNEIKSNQMQSSSYETILLQVISHLGHLFRIYLFRIVCV